MHRAVFLTFSGRKARFTPDFHVDKGQPIPAAAYLYLLFWWAGTCASVSICKQLNGFFTLFSQVGVT